MAVCEGEEAAATAGGATALGWVELEERVDPALPAVALRGRPVSPPLLLSAEGDPAPPPRPVTPLVGTPGAPGTPPRLLLVSAAVEDAAPGGVEEENGAVIGAGVAGGVDAAGRRAEDNEAAAEEYIKVEEGEATE